MTSYSSSDFVLAGTVTQQRNTMSGPPPEHFLPDASSSSDNDESVKHDQNAKSPREIVLEHCVHMLSFESATWQSLYHKTLNLGHTNSTPRVLLPGPNDACHMDATKTTEHKSNIIANSDQSIVDINALREANKLLSRKNVALRQQLAAACALKTNTKAADANQPAPHSSSVPQVSLESLTSKVRAIEKIFTRHKLARQSDPNPLASRTRKESKSKSNDAPCGTCQCCELHIHDRRSTLQRLAALSTHGRAVLNSVLDSNTETVTQGECNTEMGSLVESLETASFELNDGPAYLLEADDMQASPNTFNVPDTPNNYNASVFCSPIARRASTKPYSSRRVSTSTSAFRRPITTPSSRRGLTARPQQQQAQVSSWSSTLRGGRRSSSAWLENGVTSKLSDSEKQEEERPLPRGLYSWTTSGASHFQSKPLSRNLRSTATVP